MQFLQTLYPVLQDYFLERYLAANGVIVGIWVALAVAAVALRRAGPLLIFASLLHIPLAAGVALWGLGSQGFGDFSATWLLAGAVQAVVLFLSQVMVTIRRLSHVPKTGPRRWLRCLIDGPMGLRSALEGLISSLGRKPAIAPGDVGVEEEEDDEGVEPDTPMRKAGAEVEQTFQDIWKKDYETAIVDPKAFPHLNLRFYDETRELLVRHGFTHLADQQISLGAPGIKPTFTRMMLSGDQAVLATCNHLKLGVMMRALTLTAKNFVTQSTDFETEFTDGSFVVTTNQKAVGNFDHGDKVNSVFFEGLTLGDLGHQHYLRLAEHGQKRGVRPVLLQNLDEANASQRRLHLIKCDARGASGMTRDEYHRAAGSKGKTANELYDAWQDVRQKKAA